MFLQNRFFRFTFFLRRRIIYEQPWNVEHAAEPGDDEDDVDGFDVEVHWERRQSAIGNRQRQLSIVN